MENHEKKISTMPYSQENRQLLDSARKALLADKQNLAWILRDCTPEFRECSIPEIIGCMEGEPEIGSLPVDQNEKISGMTEEDEGTVRYDIRFKAKHQGKEIEFVINIEPRKDFNPGHDLVIRSLCDWSQMVSAQTETEFLHSNDAGVQKVHFIWVCLRPNQQWRGAVNTYTIQENLVPGSGNAQADHDAFDKMQVTLLCLDGNPTGKENVVGMLDDALFHGKTAEA